MAMIKVLDADGAAQQIERPNANGRAAASGSRPVALSSEDLAAVNAITTAIGQPMSIAGTVPVSVSALPLPSGAATEAGQATQIGYLSDISSALGGALAVTGQFYPATQPVSGSVSIGGSVSVTAASLPLPTGAASEAKQDVQTTLLTTIANALGGTLDVAVVSGGGGTGGGGDASAAKQDDQTAILSSIDDALAGTLAVTGQFYPATQPVSGTVSITGNVAVTAADLPLPAGAASAANQAIEIGHLSDISTALSGGLAVTGQFYPATQPISGSVTISGSVAVTGPLTETQLRSSALAVSAASLPLPAGAATASRQDATIAAIDALAGPKYETVAASASNQVLGGAGAVGDFLAALLIVPASTSPGAVSIKDGSGSAITVFQGGASSVTTLHPFTVPLGLISTGGAWQVSAGSNVSVIASGRFT